MNNAEFSNIMQELLGCASAPSRLAVAVSGGGDSMALALLVHEYARAMGGAILALTVDHGLRADSQAEAQETGQRLKAFGIDHRILTWAGEKPAARIQERAREARYRLLQDACRAENINALCVAHNLEDQIETFWMRLAHGSGLDGLAAMAPVRQVRGLCIIRPLLTVPREELRAYCRQVGIAWCEDPSNENEKYLRVRLRAFENLLATEGLTPQRLSQTLQKLEDDRDALRFATMRAFSACATVYAAGYALLKRSSFEELPRALRGRVLARAIAAVAPPQAYPLGRALFDALENMSKASFTGCTLAGCDVSMLDGAHILLTRELAAMASAPLEAGMVWDERFAVAGYAKEAQDGSTLSPLGEDGIAALRKILKVGGEKDIAALRLLEEMPARARRGLPSIKNSENILMVPHLSWISSLAPVALAAVRLEPLDDEDA